MVHVDVAPTARASLLPPTDSHHLHPRSLSSSPAWPAPPNADDDASVGQSDVVPNGANVAPMVHVGVAPTARASLLPPTDSHHLHLRSLSSSPAWPAPPNADDDASADQSDVVPSGANVAPMVHVGVAPTARASLLPPTDSHHLHLRSLS